MAGSVGLAGTEVRAQIGAEAAQSSHVESDEKNNSVAAPLYSAVDTATLTHVKGLVEQGRSYTRISAKAAGSPIAAGWLDEAKSFLNATELAYTQSRLSRPIQRALASESPLDKHVRAERESLKTDIVENESFLKRTDQVISESVALENKLVAAAVKIAVKGKVPTLAILGADNFASVEKEFNDLLHVLIKIQVAPDDIAKILSEGMKNSAAWKAEWEKIESHPPLKSELEQLHDTNILAGALLQAHAAKLKDQLEVAQVAELVAVRNDIANICATKPMNAKVSKPVFAAIDRLITDASHEAQRAIGKLAKDLEVLATTLHRLDAIKSIDPEAAATLGKPLEYLNASPTESDASAITEADTSATATAHHKETPQPTATEPEPAADESQDHSDTSDSESTSGLGIGAFLRDKLISFASN